MSDQTNSVAALDRSVEALIDGSSKDVDAVARALYRHQRQHCLAYDRLCESAGVNDIHGWRDVPAVPTEAFQRFDLRSFSSDETVATFRTSGTTGEVPGAHHFNTLHLYRKASVVAFREAFGLPPERIRIVSLIPSAADAPESSLSQMVSWVLESFGRADSVVDPTGVCLLESDPPALILGTSLLLYAFFERNPSVRLPPETRVMETGGFKGKQMDLTRTMLHQHCERAGLDSSRIIGEYGMTELSSQWYDGRAGHATSLLSERIYTPPPWARTRVVDPITMEDVPLGESGLLVHYDPVNRGSIQAIRTSDLGVRCEGVDGRDGFKLLGRAVGARARGCSLRYMESM